VGLSTTSLHPARDVRDGPLAKTSFGFREPMVGVVVDLPNCSKRRASIAALREKPRLIAFFRGIRLACAPLMQSITAPGATGLHF
jgi:hypothetical protein